MSYIENEARYEAAIRARIKNNAMKGWLARDPSRGDLMNAIAEEANRRGTGSFMGKMYASLLEWGKLSDKQEAACRKIFADNVTKKAEWAAKRREEGLQSKHVGKVGERRAFVLTVAFVASFEGAYGMTYITGMTEHGTRNVVVYKGGLELAAKGETVRLLATVKDHGERDGIAQTIIARPAQIELLKIS